MKHLLEIVFRGSVSILNSQNRFGFEIFTDFSWNQWELSQRLPRNKAMSTFHMIQEMNLRYHSLKMNDFYFYLLKRKVCLIRHATSPSAPEFKIKLRNFCDFCHSTTLERISIIFSTFILFYHWQNEPFSEKCHD